MTLNDAPSAPPVLSAFRRIGRRLQRMAGSILGDEADAEDALQDAFCRLWPRRADIGSEREAEALLTTTVRHLSYDTLRRRHTAATDPIDETRDAQPADDADEAAEREARFREVEAIIDKQLSPTARDILRRKEYEGQDFDTIAAELNMQPAAVRMQLSRARKIIRTCYQQLHNHE